MGQPFIISFFTFNNKIMSIELFTAIVFFQDGGKPFKYRNVNNVTRLFAHLVTKGKTPIYANLYKEKIFSGRVYRN